VDISFIILTWNSIRYIDDCISSYGNAMEREGLSAEFLIVDNGSTDGTAARLEKIIMPTLPVGCSTKLFKLPENRGTTASRNMALRDATGNTIVICDSDTEFQEGSWRDAIEYIQTNDNVGIIAPLLCFEDGTVQRSVKRFPTAADKIVKALNIGLRSKGLTSDMYKDFPWNNTRPVETAISAGWIFRKDLLDTIGYLDERIFYSPEDIDYCLRTWKAGKRVVFYPNLKITHHTQQISHRKPFSKIALSHLKGLCYYFLKHRYFLSRRSLNGPNNHCPPRRSS
jgi:GT2 family glycosyltransferase